MPFAFIILLVFMSSPAVSESRINLAALEQPQFEFTPQPPLWEDNPMYAPYATLPTAAQRVDRGPLRLKGHNLRAPNARKDTNPGADADPMNRATEQRLLDAYGTEGWEQMAVDGQLRLAPRGAAGLVPYVAGGMGVTQLSSSAATADPALNGAVGVRYGAGLAYSIGDELDFTAGYRVNRMDDQQTIGPAAERLNMQMLDFGLRYKY